MTIEPSAFRHRPDEQPRIRDLGDGRFVLENTYGSSYEYFPDRPMPVPAAGAVSPDGVGAPLTSREG